ncbi:MAG: type IX secretion system membrane protein PorP/SprF [Bacteroidia bacterium]|nr:type IX secretion system membrane protein PorP/SprF [Bacteroidia bacterium]MCZ2277851.1 type IX secretion system membrane protein PorP/SprF [Bacteroidia bacterium]
MRKYLVIVLLTILAGSTAVAQYEPHFSQYINNEMFINPAYAGTRGYMAAAMLYRDQWTGMDGAPKTGTFSFHTPFSRDRAGLGICVMNDRIGVSSQTALVLNYAYHLRVTENNGILSFGLQGGFINAEEKLRDVTTIDPNDPEFANNVYHKLMPNFGFGTYYHNDRFYAGLSIPRFLKNKIDPFSSKIESSRLNVKNWHYYLYSAYVADLGESVKMKPSVMIKAVSGAPVEAEANLNFLLKDVFWVGGGYRTGDAVIFITQYQISKQLRIGYSFDYSLTKLQNFNSGTHEFTIGYDFTFDKNKIVSPRYF